MMGFGAFAFTLCVVYIAVWSATGDARTTYVAMDDEDQLVARKKVSRWN